MNKYKVRLSAHASHIIRASTPSQARRKVWNEIKDGYTYGWTKAKFIKNAKVELISRGR